MSRTLLRSRPSEGARAGRTVSRSSPHVVLYHIASALAHLSGAIARVLRDYPVNAVSNLAFSGKISLDAAADRTFSCPVPKWTAKVRIKDASFSAVSKDTPIAAEGATVSLGASGVADHVDITPVFPRINSVTFGEYTATNLTASIRATERALMVNEAQAAFWNGHVRLYSVFLDPKTLNAGLTLFLEDIDVGSALNAF